MCRPPSGSPAGDRAGRPAGALPRDTLRAGPRDRRRQLRPRPARPPRCSPAAARRCLGLGDGSGSGTASPRRRGTRLLPRRCPAPTDCGVPAAPRRRGQGTMAASEERGSPARGWGDAGGAAQLRGGAGARPGRRARLRIAPRRNSLRDRSGLPGSARCPRDFCLVLGFLFLKSAWGGTGTWSEWFKIQVCGGQGEH